MDGVDGLFPATAPARGRALDQRAHCAPETAMVAGRLRPADRRGVGRRGQPPSRAWKNPSARPGPALSPRRVRAGKRPRPRRILAPASTRTEAGGAAASVRGLHRRTPQHRCGSRAPSRASTIRSSTPASRCRSVAHCSNWTATPAGGRSVTYPVPLSFCGAEPRKGKPYCAAHCARAYLPAEEATLRAANAGVRPSAFRSWRRRDGAEPSRGPRLIEEER